MNLFKKIIILILIILSLVSIYFGAYKPWVKARVYTSVQRNLLTYRTLDDLITNFDKVYNYNSPIGQEEIVKFTNSQFENMIQNEQQTEEASKSLVEYSEQYSFPDSVIHMLQMGNMYFVLYERFNREEYLNKAENYFLEIREKAPKIPHPLYNLYELYKKSGQEDKMNEVKQEILKFWPEEDNLN